MTAAKVSPTLGHQKLWILCYFYLCNKHLLKATIKQPTTSAMEYLHKRDTTFYSYSSQVVDEMFSELL